MADHDPFLIFGAGGWLGAAVVRELQRLGVPCAAPSRQEADVRDAAAVARVLEAQRPGTALNLAAAQPGADAAQLLAVNEGGAGHVARACAQRGIRLVHVSSDMVLDGRAAPYADDAAGNPLTPYGRSKALGEAAVLAAHPAALCVRTSLLWDPAVMDRGTRSFAQRLRTGEPCRLFSDEIRCPLDRQALARALLYLAPLDVAGTLNVAGREALSRYGFAVALLQHFGVAGLDGIERVGAADLERGGAAPRPRDLRLDVARAERLLGRRLPGVMERLRVA